MKNKIFALFMGLLCLITNVLAQSATLTGFNGRIDFSGFANNGGNIRGTLKNFTDQTGLYVASNIAIGDVAWDNNGKRYAVVSVISSTSTQAVVDLSRIGSGTHLPKGAGFVSRETSNGLALIPPVNSNGISTQLGSRAVVHNYKILEGFKGGIYSGNGTIIGDRTVQLSTNDDNEIDIRTNNSFRRFKVSMYSDENSAGVDNNITIAYHNTAGSDFSAFISGGYNTSVNDSRYSTKIPGVSAHSYIVQDTRHTSNRQGFISQSDSSSAGNGSVLFSSNPIDNQSYHYVGIGKGYTSIPNAGNYKFRAATKTFAVQTAYSSSFFNWISVDDLDVVDTTSGNKIKLYNGKYALPNARPSATASAISSLIWTAGTPSFLRSQHGVFTANTDGSGDLLLTFPTMPDITYSLIAQNEGATAYILSTQPATKATGSVKIRVFDAAGAAVTATSITISYEIKDY